MADTFASDAYPMSTQCLLHIDAKIFTEMTKSNTFHICIRTKLILFSGSIVEEVLLQFSV